ncbi:hypothetical protein [Halalkalibacter hemicellulosilyticus]|uniref:Uncharacterized protein n=1 Tax=Halalkalibacter hemicellulosilyticusJCM 9152 TaxID=1236971 RepID=W4QIU2_9BACI|nr:hypothetical protein [Halalkalibacter hemicellulosilyticus]GAE31259.1 hypothetical protein JCM9152_2716 [Halalkalibacter hemicellulosilyticusJCM 9152]
MNRLKLLIGIPFIIISFYFLLLSIMKVFPIWISAPLLFISIVLTLSPLSSQKRFKGF